MFQYGFAIITSSPNRKRSMLYSHIKRSTSYRENNFSYRLIIFKSFLSFLVLNDAIVSFVNIHLESKYDGFYHIKLLSD